MNRKALNTDGHRELFGAVLVRAILDATTTIPTTHTQKADIARARAWLDAADADFQMCCILAGFDPQAVHSKWVAGKIDPTLFKMNSFSSPKETTRFDRRRQERDERQQRVGEMVAMGMTTVAIAKALGVNKATVARDRRDLGIPGCTGKRHARVYGTAAE